MYKDYCRYKHLHSMVSCQFYLLQQPVLIPIGVDERITPFIFGIYNNFLQVNSSLSINNA